MRRVLCLIAILGAMTCLTTQSSAQPAKESAEEIEKKLKKLRDEIDELHSREKDLVNQERKLLEQKRVQAAKEKAEADRKEAERRQKEEAERKAKAEAEIKKHAVKVEIRGMLSKQPETITTPYNPVFAWTVKINELRWQLNFNGDKNLEADAKKLAGKPVVIVGTITTTRPKTLAPYYFPMPGPNTNPNSPYFQPAPPNWNVWPGPVPMMETMVINVISIVEAKD